MCVILYLPSSIFWTNRSMVKVPTIVLTLKASCFQVSCAVLSIATSQDLIKCIGQLDSVWAGLAGSSETGSHTRAGPGPSPDRLGRCADGRTLTAGPPSLRWEANKGYWSTTITCPSAPYLKACLPIRSTEFSVNLEALHCPEVIVKQNIWMHHAFYFLDLMTQIC